MGQQNQRQDGEKHLYVVKVNVCTIFIRIFSEQLCQFGRGHIRADKLAVRMHLLVNRPAFFIVERISHLLLHVCIKRPVQQGTRDEMDGVGTETRT